MPNPPPPPQNKYYLEKISARFEKGAEALKTELDDALSKMGKDPSNPELLAKYQSKLQEYTLFRNAQTSTVKAIKDIGAAIIQNFR